MRFFFFPFLILTISLCSLVSSRQLFIQSDDPDQVRQQISTDFEDGSTAPWYNFMYPNDASNGKALFELEDFNSPLQGNSPAPQPDSGTKYLRAIREKDPLQSVYRIALKSETFLAMPGDEISLKVWLRFRKSTSNSLGLYWGTGIGRDLFLGYVDASATPDNNEWTTVTYPIPLILPTNISLILYGSLSNDELVDIAVDDIQLIEYEGETTTPHPSPDGCGGIFDTGNTGIVTSPGFPELYDKGIKCKYYIRVTDKQVLLNFSAFNVIVNGDELNVYDGLVDVSDKWLVKIYYGTTPDPILSFSKDVTLVFTATNYTRPYLSDLTSNVAYNNAISPKVDYGFSVLYTGTSYTSIPGCSGSFGGTDGTFTSPNHPDFYVIANLNCTYSIKVEPGYRIYLNFSSIFGTETSYDFLNVYDGPSIYSKQLLRSHSGSYAPSSMWSTNNDMLVTFTTNNWRGNYRGFGASYTASKGPTECGGIFSGSSGTVTSPNYPNNYGFDYLTCDYQIQVASGSRIYMNFSSPFYTDSNRDFVRVYDGIDTNSFELLEASGYQVPEPFWSSSNRILMRFTSDYSSSGYTGFSATYTSALNPACGGNFGGKSGVLTSPNYPNNYGTDFLTCDYVISVAASKIVYLNFTSFDTEPNRDFIEVYDGRTTSSTLLLKVSGSNLPPPVESSSSDLLVRFTTNSVNAAFRGFSAYYSRSP